MKIAKITLDENVEIFPSLKAAADDAGMSTWKFNKRMKDFSRVKHNGNTYVQPINH